MLSIHSVYAGNIQNILDALSDQGFPQIRISEDLDRKFDEQLAKLAKSQTKYSLGVQNGLPFFQCDKSQQDYWDPNDYGRLAQPAPEWEGKYLFRTVGSSNQQVSQGEYEGDMTLPSMQEFFILFDRFAQGGDLANQIGPSYPLCRSAFENAFLGTYYSLKWYEDQQKNGFDPNILTQV